MSLSSNSTRASMIRAVASKHAALSTIRNLVPSSGTISTSSSYSSLCNFRPPFCSSAWVASHTSSCVSSLAPRLFSSSSSPSSSSSASSFTPTSPPTGPIDFNPHSRLPLSSPLLLSLDNLADNAGARKKRIRWGRGRGGGRGKTCGRGQKGMKSKGRVSMPWFEGGQTPLYRRLPKHGFSNAMFRRKLATVSLGKVVDWITMGRIDGSQKVTMKTIFDSNLCGKHLHEGVKVLSDGAHKVTFPIHLEVSECTEGARKAVESAGGSIKLVWYGRVAFRALLKPEKFLPGRLPSLDSFPPPKYHWKYQEHIRDILKKRGQDIKPFEDELKAWQDFQAKKNRKLQL